MSNGSSSGGTEGGVHDRHHGGMRFGMQRIAILGHNVGVGEEFACRCASDEGDIGDKDITGIDFIKNSLSNWRSTRYSRRIVVHDDLSIYAGVVRDSFRCIFQRDTNEMSIAFSAVSLCQA